MTSNLYVINEWIMIQMINEHTLVHDMSRYIQFDINLLQRHFCFVQFYCKCSLIISTSLVLVSTSSTSALVCF